MLQICRIFVAFIFSVAFASVLYATEQPEEITIGVIPGGNPSLIKQQGVAFAQDLQQIIKIKTNIYISKDYNTLIEAMKEKKVDFAFLTALSFVYAEKTAQAKVLLKKVYQEPFYYAALVVLSSSKIERFVDLKGKKIAYVDSKSTSGYLYPKAHLKKMNFLDTDFKHVVYSGNHSQSVQMLEEGKVDVIAVFSDDAKGIAGAWTKFGKLDKKKYKVLWVSDPVPSDPLTVRQGFYDQYPNVSHMVMVGIIDIFEKPENKGKYSEILGSKSLMPATSRQYDPVRDVIKNLNIQIN
ncbi:MAG: phosphate/phosphite/phosphonate ABC transporter substrate-binding protein [Bdellovibrionaceae bacterium]|nr:phosphate/phosphite/phosphonate ABC transporter substrate-binding protein [Pseudobdellovibrionaceae bacterium]